MAYALSFQPRRCRVQCAVIVAAICLVVPSSHAQQPPASTQTSQSPASPLEFLAKFPGLPEAMNQLFEKLYKIEFPAARTESRLLPLLPPSTVGYAALPNYGGTAEQALKIFRQAMQENEALRNFMQQGEMAGSAPKIEKFLEKFAQLHGYLGNELVMSAAVHERNPRFLLIAEIRKPGLQEFLQQMVKELASEAKPGVRVLGPKEFAALDGDGPPDEIVVLVRDDFAVAAQNLAALRSFVPRLDTRTRDFASLPFGHRGIQEYASGLTILMAADLQEIMKQLPASARQDPTFQSTGFADVKYFVWDHKDIAGKTVSQSELSFTGPRRGIASWLAKSRPLSSLNFVSPDAMVASTVALKNPALIFEEVKKLATLANPAAFASLEQMEQALNLSLANDLLSHLGGEITLELDQVIPQPAWRVIFSVKNAEPLQQTLNTLLANAPFAKEQTTEAGVTYNTLQIPTGQTAMEIGYSFVDGHLVIGSGRSAVADAVRMQRSGQSLGKSNKLLASLPPGDSQEASGMMYVDTAAMSALQMRMVAPQVAESMAQHPAEMPPAVVRVYGEDAAIRQSTTNPAFDSGVILIFAAIAIPNLLRARISANEASAVGSLRSVNTAQVMYAATYEQRGFAPNLATLGPTSGSAAPSADRADLLDSLLGNSSCTGDAWCTKSGYLFRVTGVCKQKKCDEYVVIATPVTPGTTGMRSFCSTSDGVIRMKAESVTITSLSVTECKEWPPIS